MTGSEKKYDLLLERARNWCSRREMCKSEVKLRLQKTDLNEEEISQILLTLIEEKFIDENRFAKAFVHDKIAYQKWGIQKIKQAMYFKGISKENIEEAIKGVDKEEYLKKFFEIGKARLRTIKGENDYERNKKLMRFLLSKGVNTDDIFRILKKINEEK